MSRGYPRPVPDPVLTPVPPEAFAGIRDTVARIEQEASRTDAHPSLGEAVWIDLQEPRADSAAFLVDTDAFAHVARSDNSAPRQWSMGMTLASDARDGETYARLVRAVVDHVAEHGGGHLVYWVFDAKPDDDRRLAAEGFEPARDLYEMRVPLPLGEAPKWPDGVSVRHFEPGGDDDAWLAVNNRAFAGHAEQGEWTDATLARRMAEPWFDPALFLLAFDDDGLAGFNWLKIHDPDRTPDPGNARLGEIFVIGVDPRAQGTGLGRALAVAGLDAVSERGVETGMLFTAADNSGALHLYRALGFTVHRVDRSYEREVEAA
jgi:mycothiol synthase